MDYQERDILSEIMETLTIGPKISSMLNQFTEVDQVLCVVAASLDCWAHAHDANSVEMVETMLTMMREVSDERLDSEDLNNED